MAQVMKRRSLVNSGRRRRRNGPRVMSAKQIKYFGTPAQKAALKRKRKRNYGTATGRSFSYLTARKLGKTVRRRKAVSKIKTRKRRRNSGVNSFRRTKKRVKKFFGVSLPRKSRRAHRRKRRSNVGQIFSIGLAGLNPGRKRRVTRKRRTSNNMARRRRRNAATRRSHARRRYTHKVTYRRRRRSNTGSYRRHRRMHNRRRRHSNPGFTAGAGSMFKSALGIIGGAVATRYTTQFVLQGKNTGWMGYLGNAVAALVLGWAAKKFLKSPQLGTMVTLGGFTGLALRLLTDLTPVGQYVNLQLSGAGKAGDIGIGLISDSVFVVPTVFENGSMTQAQIPTQYRQAMSIAAAAGGKGMGAYRRRRVA